MWASPNMREDFQGYVGVAETSGSLKPEPQEGLYTEGLGVGVSGLG